MKFKLSLLLLLLPIVAAAQIKIQGTVISSSDHQPMIGVTVRIAGTNILTVTDADGHYIISAKKPGALEYSFIGCKNETRPFSSTTTLNVEMSDDVNQLDEVVVIGYGSMKKSDLTGSVATISAKDLKKTPAASVDQALQGRAAGVTVNASSGQPGQAAEVRIRGIGTVNNSAPIYVVDGVITDNISFLSPNDIESTEILKDASATAIYGSRGANGVVLITTKKGEKGVSTISLDMYYGFQSRWKKLKLMNSSDFFNTYEAINAAKSEQTFYNKYGFNRWLQTYKLGNDPHFAIAKIDGYTRKGIDYGIQGLDYSAVNTDWQDEVFKSNAPIQNYHVSFDGGGDKTSYSMSASYFNQEGTIIGSNYERFTLRANTSYQLKPWLKIGENLSYVYSMGRTAMNNSSSANASVISAAIAMAPWDLAYYPENAVNVNGADMGGRYAAPSNFKNATNPFSMVYTSHPKSRTSRWIGDIYLEFTPFKGFSYRTDASYDEVNLKYRLFKDAHDVSVKDYLENNFLERSLSHYSTFTWENIVNYVFDINKIHSFNLMVGQTTEEYNYYSIGNSGSGILNPDEKNWYLNQTTLDNTNKAGDGVSRTRRLSFLGRAHYTLLDRYMFTFNFRADGSNKFPENTWGYFPSLAAAWRVSEEPWLKGKWAALDYLKLRAGWGQIGNDKIGNDAFNQTIFTSGPTFVGYPFNGTIANGATILTYVNQGGKWERTETWNAGIDAALWNGKLSFTVEGFIRNTKDMLLYVKGPAWVGNRYDAQANVGTVRNSGVEITLGHHNTLGDFTYGIDGNMSFIKNELTALNGGAPVYGDRVMSDEGLPLFTFWGYKYKGVFASQADADAALPGYAKSGQANPYGTGDAIYEDINHDGVIDDNDKTKLGNNFPKVSYGLNLSASWKNIDLQLFFQGVAGNKIYNALNERLYGTGTESNLSSDMLKVWSWENADSRDYRVTDYAQAGIPNPKHSINFYNSDRFIESGSYLRLKNIQLGYNFPDRLIKPLGLKTLRVYLQASNLFTITDYSGYDPEVAGGVDYGNYPQARTYLMGLNLNF